MTNGRFSLMILPNSSDVWGWNGYVLDRATSTKHPLIKTYVDYFLDGEVGYGYCAFDTKAEMKAAARRKALKLLKRAA